VPPQPQPQPAAHPCTIVPGGFVYPIATKGCPTVAETDPVARRLHIANPSCTSFVRCVPGGDIDRPTYQGPCKLTAKGKPAIPLDEPSCTRLEPTDPLAIEALKNTDATRVACSSMFRCPLHLRPIPVDPTHVIRPPR